MNIEELKLVLETIQQTTDGAKELGFWWIIMHYGTQVFHMMMWVLCVLGVAWGIVKAIVIASGSSDSEQNLRELRDLLRIGTPGSVSPREFTEMRDKIRDFMKEQK